MTSSNGEANAYGLTTPDSWWNTTLEEVCSGDGGRIQTGPFGSQLHAHDYRDEGTPVVMPKQLGDNMISTNGIARISDEDVERLSRHKLCEGDIVFSRRGDVTRRSYITKDEEGWLCGTGCMLIRPRHEKLLNEFLALFFSLPQFKDYITLNAVGATMPNLNTKILQNIPLFLPSRATQRKIVAVITAYDDLIENNTRRIAILEEMAQAIYREWFVNFRFPGHENVKLVDSPLGQIPEGWEVSPVSEVFETLGGGTPSKKVDKYWDGGDITWFAPSDLTKSGNMYSASSGACITEAGLKKSSAKLFPAYSVMLTSRATIGVLSINTVPGCTNQGFITCVPNERVSALQIFFWLREQNDKILNVATGATFKEITKGNFRKFPFLLPPSDIAEQFNGIVAPFGRNIEVLIQKQKNLRTTRDLLLPKLISGKLDVEDLDIDVGMTAEALKEATA